MKRLVIISFTLLLGLTSMAQGKYGADSLKCVENLSLYRDYYKQKVYEDAYNYWKVVFEICPASSERMYVDGVSLVGKKIKAAKTAEEKAPLVEELMKVYDQRIQNFGKEGYVLGRKGTDMLRYKKSETEAHFAILNKSIEAQGEKSEAGVIVSYMTSSVLMEKEDKLSKDEVVEKFTRLSEIIATNIAKYEGKPTKDYYIKAQSSVENLASPYLSCDIIIELSEKNFEKNKEDQKWMERTADLLDKKGCSEAPIFFKIAEELHRTNPSAVSAEKMGIMSLKKKNYEDAENYFKQAIELNQDESKQFNYLIELASAQTSRGSYSSARSSARKAAEVDPSNGLPYIMIADMIASSSKACTNGDACKHKAIYWLATDYLNKAIAVDASVRDKASAKIASYKKYFPERDECFFINVKDGDSVDVGCWIGESTKARFN